MKRKRPSLRIAADRLLCRPAFGIPFFFAVLAVVFSLSFYGIGDVLSRFLERVLLRRGRVAEELLLRHGAPPSAIRYLIVGIYDALASSIAFLPQTVIFFLLIRILEDCGYLSRAVLVTDRFFRIFGLSGTAVIPLLLGYGCAVSSVCICCSQPAQKNAVIRALPFVPCSARVPVLLFLADTFFPDCKTVFCVSVFILSFVLIFLTLLIAPRGKVDAPAHTEDLPEYRMPRVRNLLSEVFDTARGYLLRAGTAVGICSAVCSALAMLTPSLAPAGDIHRSILYVLATGIAPILRPLGFASPEAAAALFFGFFAKENIIGVLQISAASDLSQLFTPISAASFTVFAMFYAPCASLLVTVARQSGGAAARRLFWRTFAIAYTLSFILYTMLYILVPCC